MVVLNFFCATVSVQFTDIPSVKFASTFPYRVLFSAPCHWFIGVCPCFSLCITTRASSCMRMCVGGMECLARELQLEWLSWQIVFGIPLISNEVASDSVEALLNAPSMSRNVAFAISLSSSDLVASLLRLVCVLTSIERFFPKRLVADGSV